MYITPNSQAAASHQFSVSPRPLALALHQQPDRDADDPQGLDSLQSWERGRVYQTIWDLLRWSWQGWVYIKVCFLISRGYLVIYPLWFEFIVTVPFRWETMIKITVKDCRWWRCSDKSSDAASCRCTGAWTWSVMTACRCAGGRPCGWWCRWWGWPATWWGRRRPCAPGTAGKRRSPPRCHSTSCQKKNLRMP